MAVEPRFEVAGHAFHEGLVVIGASQPNGLKYGYCDQTGAVVIEPRHDFAGDFSEGLAAAAVVPCLRKGVMQGKVGFIEKTGRIVIQPQYTGARPFRDGIAYVETDVQVMWIARASCFSSCLYPFPQLLTPSPVRACGPCQPHQCALGKGRWDIC